MPILRILLAMPLVLLAALSACKPYEDLRGPVSGVKVAKPLDLFILPTDTVVFSGVCLDEKGLTSIRYGLKTSQFAWEGTNDAILADTAWDSTLVGTLQNFSDTVFMSSSWPQGRLLSYSIVQNSDGNHSDTNKAYKYLRNYAYPYLSLTRPIANATFSIFRAGDTVQIAGVVEMRNFTDKNDSILVAAQPCLLHTDGTLDCSAGEKVSLLQYIIPPYIRKDSAFAGKIEMPITAQPGQLYRLKISAVGTATKRQTYLAPGFQLRAQ